jgi:hypothetical protein
MQIEPLASTLLAQRYEEVVMKKIHLFMFSTAWLLGTPLTALSSEQELCPVGGAPCHFYARNDITIMGARLSWSDVTGWDSFNVRWGLRGGAEKQSSTKGTRFHIKYLLNRRTYVFKVQGCNKKLFGRSECSGWNTIYKTIDFSKNGR